MTIDETLILECFNKLKTVKSEDASVFEVGYVMQV